MESDQYMPEYWPANRIIGKLEKALVKAENILGLIQSTQIANLAAAKVTGLLTSAQIAEIEAAKIGGKLTNAQIESIEAAKITGQIVETQIGPESITTGKIKAANITTALLAVGLVTAEKLAVGSVIAEKLAVNSVTAAKIAVGAVIAEKISVATLSAISANLGTIKSGTIEGVTIKALDAFLMEESGELLEEINSIIWQEGTKTREYITGYKTAEGERILQLGAKVANNEPAFGEDVYLLLVGSDWDSESLAKAHIKVGLWERLIINQNGESNFLQLSAERREIDYGLVEALPGSPKKGDRCHYIADKAKGIIWDLIYDGAWWAAKGPPLRAFSVEARTLNNKVAFTALPTDPLSVTVPLKGDYNVRIEGTINNKAAGRAGELSYTVGATAANANWALRNTSAGQTLVSESSEYPHTEVAAGAKIEEQGRTEGAYEIDFARRRLWVEPVRVK